MRKHCSMLVIGGCFGLFLSLFPSVAQAGICRNVCTPTASCSLVCTAIGGGEPEITTCGEWGVCAGAPLSSASTSNWMTTSTQAGCAIEPNGVGLQSTNVDEGATSR